MQFLDGEEWRAFCDVITEARKAEIPLLIGGALALAAYMPLTRRTKDIDFYVMPEDRERMVALLNRKGFVDYYDQLPYDRRWIYRSIRGEVITDIIWSFANQRAVVDADWFTYSTRYPCADDVLHIVPAEEMIWSKLFVFQRERCDWTDLLNLLYFAGASINWTRLRERLGPDQPLLDALLSVFAWLCPGHKMDQPIEPGVFDCEQSRAALLDSRPWFLPELAVAC